MTALAIGTRADKRDLRRKIYGEGEPTRADIEELLGLGRREEGDAEFAELLADVATDVLIRQADPPGFIADADASSPC